MFRQGHPVLPINAVCDGIHLDQAEHLIISQTNMGGWFFGGLGEDEDGRRPGNIGTPQLSIRNIWGSDEGEFQETIIGNDAPSPSEWTGVRPNAG